MKNPYKSSIQLRPINRLASFGINYGGKKKRVKGGVRKLYNYELIRVLEASKESPSKKVKTQCKSNSQSHNKHNVKSSGRRPVLSSLNVSSAKKGLIELQPGAYKRKNS